LIDKPVPPLEEFSLHRVAEITDPFLALILAVFLGLPERLQNLRSNSLAR
jgi:hypothetical protein